MAIEHQRPPVPEKADCFFKPVRPIFLYFSMKELALIELPVKFTLNNAAIIFNFLLIKITIQKQSNQIISAKDTIDNMTQYKVLIIFITYELSNSTNYKNHKANKLLGQKV